MMKLAMKLSWFGCILVPLALAIATSARAEPSYPLGSRVGLEVPKGLAPSTAMPGFEDTDRKVAISILDLPGPAFADVERAVFNMQKGQPGVSDEKREAFVFHSGAGFLFSFQLIADGVTYRKWVLLAGSASAAPNDITAVVSVQVPENARTAYSDETIRAALASVTYRPTPIQEQLGLLPFKLSDLAGFRVVRAMPAGGVMLTDGPNDNTVDQANIIISIAQGGPQQASDRRSFAEQVMATTPIMDMRLTNSEAMRVNGQPGYEVRAEGNDGRGGTLSIVQWLRFGSSGYLRVLAVSRKEQWNDAFPRFRAVRDGIEAR